MKVVIMAGGEGKRLKPLTNGIPKPMLPIGRKPLLQILIEQLKKYELKDIIIATGYKDHIIKSYFRDGSHFGINISYTSENYKLGTVGPLKLLDKKTTNTFLVINGDILTRFNFRKIVDKHNEDGNDMTVGVSKYKLHVPFGIVETENGDGVITSVREKPNLEFLILSGIYVINSSVISYIPSGVSYDIPQLIEDLLKDNKRVRYYQIEGEWLDIGRIEDYEFANKNWDKWL